MARYLTFLGAGVIAATAHTAHAQTVYDLGEIVISGGLEPAEAGRTGATVEIIGQEDLAATEELRIQDVLARVPGVSIRSQGPTGSQTGLTIRGVGQNNIAVRVDGIDVSDPAGPQVAYDFGGLTAGGIGRIEVLKGSQSALYGSEAMGGVIDIRSVRAERDGLSASSLFEYGSFETMRSSNTVAQRGDGHDVAVTLSYTRSEGFSAADENAGNTETDGYEAIRASLAGSMELGTTTLHVATFHEEAEFGYDDLGTPPTDNPFNTTDKEQSGYRLALDFALGRFDNTVSVSSYHIIRQNTGDGAFGPFDYTFDGLRTEAGWQMGTDIGATGRLAGGLSATAERYKFDGFGSVSKYDTDLASLFGEYTVAVTPSLDLSAAARLDNHSEFGTFTSGRLAFVWRGADGLALRGSLANGYRAPSPYELYDAFSGNEDLEPETSRSAELGIEKRYDRASVSATLFAIEAENLIDYSFSEFRYVQAEGTSTRSGLELSGSYELAGGVLLTGAYTLTRQGGSADLDSSGWLASAPEHSLSASISGNLTDKLSATHTLLYEAGRAGLEDYATVGTTWSYALNDGLNAYLRVENLLDAEYQTSPGYGTPDRSVYAGIRASF